MASSTGISENGLQPLSDWRHVEQSIRKILMTPLGSRVMLREFGSELWDLVDQKMTQANILKIYSAAAVAIHRWEPRFRMRQGTVDVAGFAATQDGRTVRAGANGLVSLQILGTYFPKGHLGDYSIAESAETRVIYERAA